MTAASDDPLTLLDALLGAGETRVAAAALGERASAALAALREAGLIVPDGTVGSIVCDACDDLHLAAVGFNAERCCYGWRCPEAGFVAAADEQVAALSLGMATTGACLAKAFRARFGAGRWALREVAGDDLWVVGVWEIGGASTTVTLARRLGDAAVARRTSELLRGLPANDAGLVLTVGAASGFEPPPRYRAIPLVLAVTAVAGGVAINDPIVIAAASHAAFTLSASRAGRPGVEAAVHAVLEGLRVRGRIPERPRGLTGLITRAWPEFRPGEACPKGATVRKHASSWLRNRHKPPES